MSLLTEGRHTADTENWWRRRSRKGKVGLIFLGFMAIGLLAWAIASFTSGVTGSVSITDETAFSEPINVEFLNLIAAKDCVTEPAISDITVVADGTGSTFDVDWNITRTFLDGVYTGPASPLTCSIALRFDNLDAAETYRFIGVTLPAGLSFVSATYPSCTSAIDDFVLDPGEQDSPFNLHIQIDDLETLAAVSFDPLLHGVQWLDDATFVGDGSDCLY